MEEETTPNRNQIITNKHKQKNELLLRLAFIVTQATGSSRKLRGKVFSRLSSS